MPESHRLRSLGKRLFRVTAPCACALLTSAVVLTPLRSADAVELRVLRSDESVLEVEWTMTAPDLETVQTLRGPARRPVVEGGIPLAAPGEPDLPSVVQLVGVPSPVAPQVQVVSVTTDEMPFADMAPAPRPVTGEAEDGGQGPREIRSAPLARGSGVSPAAWAEFLGVSTVRTQRLARLAIHPCRYDASRGVLQWARSLRLRVTFPPADRARLSPGRPQPADWEDLMRGTVLNADVARGWRTAAGPVARGSGDSFDSSLNWVKVPIRDTGVYRVDYFTFANLGVDPANVDPRTVRVFSGTSMPLRENLIVPPPSFMTECALKDLGDGDGVFDLDDRFLFFAHAPTGWANEFEPTLSRFDYVENEYGDTSYCWLTWEAPGNTGSFGNLPRRMATRSVVDTTFGGPFPRSTPHRLHFEQNNTENFAYPAEDGWMWEDLRGRGQDRSYPLTVPQPASGDGIVRARVYSHQAAGRNGRKVEVKLQGVVTTTWQWIHDEFHAVYDVTGCYDGLLVDGSNLFQLNASFDDGVTIDHIYTGWFDVEYDRELSAGNGRYLHFFTDAAPPALPTAPAGSIPCTALPDSLVYGRSAFRLSGFDAPPDQIHLFDVTDQHGVVDLTDFRLMNGSAPYDIRFSDPGLAGVRWYVAVTMDGVRTLPNGEFATIRGLRNPQLNEATYLVIYSPEFEAGARRLAEVRGRDGRYVTKAVSAEDVYQEFGWGMRDPVAVRDFLAVAQTWHLSPLYVVLVGDACFDTKGYLSGSPTDFLSTYTRRYREASVQYESDEVVDFYSTDDFFGYLDGDDYQPGNQPGLDIAIARVPVSGEDELDVVIDKLESYLANEQPGQWQNRVMLVADDERVLEDGIREKYHTEQVETLSRFRLPPAIDRVKVYLVDYPRNAFGKKPEAQQAFIDNYTRGALMVTYTGHGDQNTMAQEEVFVSQKVAELRNEVRYTIFSTFSCQVSRFDLLSGSSMTELMLFHPEGGAVTTFASGGLVYPSPSANLNQEWLGAMYGTPYVIPTYSRRPRPIGLAALASKVIVGSSTGNRKNNEKYVALGDPALVVRFGDALVDFEAATVDSQSVEENLRVIRGAVRDDDGNVLDGTQGTVPFSGTAWVHVTEDADTTGYFFTTISGATDHIDFTLDGSTAFRGQVPVTNGRFETRFYLNEGTRSGNMGRVSVFAVEDGGSRDASGAYDALVLAPTLSPSQVDDTQGPRVTIRFEGYDRFVDGDLVFTDQPVLVVEVEDPSGVNLRPFPQFARLEAEMDGRDRLDLADDFSFAEGSFTLGEVRRPLSLAAGPHTIQVKAFDNVGNRGEAEVNFTVVLADAAFDLVDRVVTPFPNPFRQRVDIVFQLTHAADVRLKVYTLTGRKIYEAPVLAGAAGQNVISWNGNDDNGSPLANGTYLYKLEAKRTSGGEDGRSSDEFVGKIVRMR